MNDGTKAMIAPAELLAETIHCLELAHSLLPSGPYRDRIFLHSIRLRQAASVERADDWKDDPSADERWNAGLDFGMAQLCAVLGVDPKAVNWDAATETLDGDVCAAIGNILRETFGEDFDPTATPVEQTEVAGELQADLDALCEEYAEISRIMGRRGTEEEKLSDQVRAALASPPRSEDKS